MVITTQIGEFNCCIDNNPKTFCREYEIENEKQRIYLCSECVLKEPFNHMKHVNFTHLMKRGGGKK